MRAGSASNLRRQKTSLHPDDLRICAFSFGNNVLLHFRDEWHLRAYRRRNSFLRPGPNELLLPHHLHYPDYNLVLHYFQPAGPCGAKWQFDGGYGGCKFFGKSCPRSHDPSVHLLCCCKCALLFRLSRVQRDAFRPWHGGQLWNDSPAGPGWQRSGRIGR